MGLNTFEGDKGGMAALVRCNQKGDLFIVADSRGVASCRV